MKNAPGSPWRAAGCVPVDRQKNAAPTIAGTAPVVDDKRLELLTLRTSSGCSTN